MVKYINTQDKLPIPGDLNTTENGYYLVIIEGYGAQLAMYLKDEYGKCDWYSDYVSKIFRNVISYAIINSMECGYTPSDLKN